MEEQGAEEAITASVGVVRGTDPRPPVTLSDATVASSEPFVGRWSRLVSTTNWEKGRIISEWRESLEASDAAVTEYSDEAWSQLVGHVTSQHVGRLRRVHQRFAAVRDDYDGLYWSHFQTSLDWEDAELWLQGAIDNGWSVSKMRAARWESVGAPDGVKPAGDDILETAIDEDAYDALMRRDEPDREPIANDSEPTAATPRDQPTPTEADDDGADVAEQPVAPRTRPFAEIGELPDDVAEAFEQFKLAILNHKLTGWQSIDSDDLLACLDALKVLVATPADTEPS